MKQLQKCRMSVLLCFGSMWGSCVLGTALDQLQTVQVNMSVAVIPMAAELGWSASDRGLVSSAFFWGYSATQIPAGWVSTRCLPK